MRITQQRANYRNNFSVTPQYNILQITVPHNLPEFPSATSEKLDVARYACVFLLCRMKIHSALLVQLIFVCCTGEEPDRALSPLKFITIAVHDCLNMFIFLKRVV